MPIKMHLLTSLPISPALALSKVITVRISRMLISETLAQPINMDSL